MWSTTLRALRSSAPRSAVLGRRAASSGGGSGAASSVGGIPQALYNNVWRKSNIMYITYIVAGCVVIEVVYGSVTTSIWETRNKGVSLCGSSLAPGTRQLVGSNPAGGQREPQQTVDSHLREKLYSLTVCPYPPHLPQKLFKQIDWSKFKSEDDEEDEE